MPNGQSSEHEPLNPQGNHVSFEQQAVGGTHVDHATDAHGHTRSSYAAALWNPMNEVDKLKFNQRRLIQMAAGILLAVTAGSAYAFGVFSRELQTSADLSQSDLTTITTIGSIMNGFTFPAGILYDYAGPQYVLGASALFSCTGFTLFALIFKGIVTPTVVTISIANGLTNWGSGFNDCGSIMTSLFNFPINRGEVMIIQKTFFGLGSTFLTLIYGGFFSENYIGYAVFVCIFVAVSGSFGAFITRLPTYKRTTRELSRIAKIDPVQQEAEREVEERSFELYHNPRLVDRRRLNLGVTCLFFTLVFFSTFSIVKAYVKIPANVLIGLTVLACLCILSFFMMILPCKMPSFLDYDWLPDLHPPEELMDTPKMHKPHSTANDRDDAISQTTREYVAGPETSNALINHHHDDEHHADGAEGRASAFLAQRASVVGNSAPIALPVAVDPMVIPSVKTGFSTNILQPLIWCFWITGFAMFGSNTVLVQNLTQIMTSANGGAYDAALNSLIVALTGLGSACGRVIVGFVETYLHRRNALLREEQMKFQARQEGLISAEEAPITDVDMSPIYHRWNSSVLMLLPLTPAVQLLCAVSLTFLPVSTFAPIYFVSGIAMGAYLATFALGVREIFSVDIAKHYNFVASAGMLSSVLLNRLMFGMWYDEKTDNHPAPGTARGCAGVVCFSGPALVLAGLLGIAIFSSVYIVLKWWRIRKTY